MRLQERVRETGITPAGVLADIAHELSSIQEWRDRIGNVLCMLSDVLPQGEVALGIQIDGWEMHYCENTSDPEELEETLHQHLSILTGEEQPPIIARFGVEGGTPTSIRGEEGAPSSFISLPVIGADQVLGVLHVRTPINNAYSLDDISLLSVTSLQIGSFLKNVQSYDEEILIKKELEIAFIREQHITDILQKALVSDIDLQIKNLSIAARYQPALKEAEVGGDFFDVFPLHDGRLAIVMGDVSGKGLQAAVHTAMAKYMLRAFAHDNPDPAYVLASLNEALSDYLEIELFVTIFYGVFDPDTNTITCANAGHEQPLVYCSETGNISLLDITGRAVGISRGASYEQKTIKLCPKGVLLIYTDGIIDARRDTEFFGIEKLSEVLVSNAKESAEHIIESVLKTATDFANGNLRDDAAVLAMKAARA